MKSFSTIATPKNEKIPAALRSQENPAVDKTLPDGNIIQPKLTISAPGDSFEREADAMAARVMRMPGNANSQNGDSFIQRKCADCEKEEDEKKKINRKPLADSITPFIQTKTNGEPVAGDAVSSSIQQSRGNGSSLDNNTQFFMESRFGANFSSVKIHTDGESVQMNKGLNAAAFTVGNDIYFNENKYQPHTTEGRQLLAHELTHTIQQGNISGNHAQKMLIQRTGIGEILDEFFDVYSEKRLWIMEENDDYTQIVKEWQPVVDALAEIEESIKMDCLMWDIFFRSAPGWKPAGKAGPPPDSFSKGVKSPPGTDPKTCAKGFLIRKTTGEETKSLHTCSIGSFTLYVTVDAIDCESQVARVNIWMYNAMTQTSFGRFAKYFPGSGMEDQYMWWNWEDIIIWSPVGDFPEPSKYESYA